MASSVDRFAKFMALALFDWLDTAICSILEVDKNEMAIVDKSVTTSKVTMRALAEVPPLQVFIIFFMDLVLWRVERNELSDRCGSSFDQFFYGRARSGVGVACIDLGLGKCGAIFEVFDFLHRIVVNNSG